MKGTLAPKLEVSTKTTVEETLCDNSEIANSVIANPKCLISTQLPQRKSRPKRVCHSVAFSR
ncbi:hypothetical protein NQ314_019324 [Rhamnusium bicolor]|uniref:Uncharacterized protein n=1 Tax=Rhamnusium bicolor TaxID=1586634 RepID=A0AAV8WNY8_9CUCU|nr:hypothetical protein NQ314_019324 [Rhamnusium bicolor]